MTNNNFALITASHSRKCEQISKYRVLFNDSLFGRIVFSFLISFGETASDIPLKIALQSSLLASYHMK